MQKRKPVKPVEYLDGPKVKNPKETAEMVKEIYDSKDELDKTHLERIYGEEVVAEAIKKGIIYVNVPSVCGITKTTFDTYQKMLAMAEDNEHGKKK